MVSQDVAQIRKTWAKLAIDGSFGTLSRKAMQSFLKWNGWYSGVIDGKIGAKTVKGIQKWCRKAGHYPASKWVIDGKMGKATWEAVNKTLKVKKGTWRDELWGIHNNWAYGWSDTKTLTFTAWQKKLNAARP